MGKTREAAGAVASPIPKAPGRKCTVCHNPHRAEIDARLVAGGMIASISKDFGISSQAVLRHRDRHLPVAARLEGAEATAEADGHRAASLLDSATDLRDRALAILAKAEKAGALTVALQGIREAARCIELQAKLTGEIDDGVHLNIIAAPAIIQLQQVVLMALAPYPAAREAVVAALSGVGGPALIEHEG